MKLAPVAPWRFIVVVAERLVSVPDFATMEPVACTVTPCVVPVAEMERAPAALMRSAAVVAPDP